MTWKNGITVFILRSSLILHGMSSAYYPDSQQENILNHERRSNRISDHSVKSVPTISHQQMRKQTTFTFYSFHHAGAPP